MFSKATWISAIEMVGINLFILSGFMAYSYKMVGWNLLWTYLIAIAGTICIYIKNNMMVK